MLERIPPTAEFVKYPDKHGRTHCYDVVADADVTAWVLT